MSIKRHIRSVPDFPKPGILFRDITPLLSSPAAFREVVHQIAVGWTGRVNTIVGLDARGFIFGAAVAYEMGLPFVPVRKKGKLPHDTIEVEYALEYGFGTVEIHTDASDPSGRVLIVDDLLATGGTAEAACKLVEKLGAKVVGCAFVIELADLNGRSKLKGRDIQALAVYENELA